MNQVLLLALLLGSVAAPTVWAADALLINGNADFVLLDLSTGRIGASWQLGRVEGVGSLIPPGMVDGQRIEGAAYDERLKILYALLPVEARLVGEGRKHYRVAALVAPQFKLLGTWEVPGMHGGTPSLFLRPAPRQLLVQFGEEEPGGALSEELHMRTIFLEVPSLKPIRSVESSVPRDLRKLGPNTAIPSLGEDAIAVSEDLFFDSARLIRLRPDSLEARYVWSEINLGPESEALRAQVAPPLPETGRPNVTSLVVAQEAGRALVRVSPVRSEDGDRFLYYIYNPTSRAAGPAFLAPRSVGGLLDGRIVLQEYAGESTTGRLEIYDWSTGERLDVLESPLLAGDDFEQVGIVCGTDRWLLLRGSGGSLRRVDLESREVTAPATSFYADSWTHCFIASQPEP